MLSYIFRAPIVKQINRALSSRKEIEEEKELKSKRPITKFVLDMRKNDPNKVTMI